MDDNNIVDLGIRKIGAGLGGGGDWDIISKIINDILFQSSYNVYVYEL